MPGGHLQWHNYIDADMYTTMQCYSYADLLQDGCDSVWEFNQGISPTFEVLLKSFQFMILR